MDNKLLRPLRRINRSQNNERKYKYATEMLHPGPNTQHVWLLGIIIINPSNRFYHFFIFEFPSK